MLNPARVLCEDYTVIKYHVSTMLTNQVINCQVCVIGKAIRPLFADPVTYILMYNMYWTIYDFILLWLLCAVFKGIEQVTPFVSMDSWAPVPLE